MQVENAELQQELVTRRRGDSELVGVSPAIQRIKDKKTVEQLRYYFDYLHHAEGEIANDAFYEFERATYKDHRAVAETLPPGRLRARRGR